MQKMKYLRLPERRTRQHTRKKKITLVEISPLWHHITTSLRGLMSFSVRCPNNGKLQRSFILRRELKTKIQVAFCRRLWKRDTKILISGNCTHTPKHSVLQWSQMESCAETKIWKCFIGDIWKVVFCQLHSRGVFEIILDKSFTCHTHFDMITALWVWNEMLRLIRLNI